MRVAAPPVHRVQPVSDSCSESSQSSLYPQCVISFNDACSSSTSSLWNEYWRDGLDLLCCTKRVKFGPTVPRRGQYRGHKGGPRSNDVRTTVSGHMVASPGLQWHINYQSDTDEKWHVKCCANVGCDCGDNIGAQWTSYFSNSGLELIFDRCSRPSTNKTFKCACSLAAT